MGRRVLKFDGAFGPEGCGIALTGDEHKVSVTGLAFCVIGAAVSGQPIKRRSSTFLISPAVAGVAAVSRFYHIKRAAMK